MRKFFKLALTVTLLCTVHQSAAQSLIASGDAVARTSNSFVRLKASLHSPPFAQGSTSGVPIRVVIPSVPFVSWNDAAHLEFQDKDFLNPSTAAAFATILKFWEQDLDLLKAHVKAFPRESGGWAITETGSAKSLADLKPLLARGLPVVVYTAITPFAHPVNPTAAAFGAMKKVKLKEPGPQSRILPLMTPFETFRSLDEAQLHPWETLYDTARVLIGYDDTRRLVTLHDASFGPAWQIAYDEFDVMWAARGRGFMVARPNDASKKASVSSDYPARTVDQLAATHWVMGSALAAAGRQNDAEAEIKKGLSLADIGKGYQHVLLFELAVQRYARGDIGEAINRSEAAAELVPQDPRPWILLAQAYGQGTPSRYRNAQRAEDAQKRAEEVGRCSENAQVSNHFEVRVMPPEMLQESQRDLANLLAHDFYISAGCRSSIMWLLGP
jgi:tetratricopeptide (TPR) repeat protein